MNITTARRRPVQRRVETRNRLTPLAQLDGQSAVCLQHTTTQPTVGQVLRAAKGISSFQPATDPSFWARKARSLLHPCDSYTLGNEGLQMSRFGSGTDFPHAALVITVK
jgi:hypothetical protein